MEPLVSSAGLIRYSQDVVYLVHQKSLVNQDGMGMGSYNFIAVNGNIFCGFTSDPGY